jgi:hypothetical protein
MFEILRLGRGAPKGCFLDQHHEVVRGAAEMSAPSSIGQTVLRESTTPVMSAGKKNRRSIRQKQGVTKMPPNIMKV